MGMTEAHSLAIESWTLYTVAILVVIARTYVKITPLAKFSSFAMGQSTDMPPACLEGFC